MALLSLRNVSFGYGGPLLVENINLEIEPGQRIGLLGRNGAGKSTLLKLINGEVKPDGGEIAMQNGLCVARLIQEVPAGARRTVFAEVAEGLLHLAGDTDQMLTPDGLSARGEWQSLQKIESLLLRMDLPADAEFAQLSAGLKRRVLLARSLVRDPDVLLLDEPTNHLDIEAIDWLETFLLRFPGTLIFVTHDRVFLQKLATRVIEVDRGRLLDWTCDYATFLRRKEAALEVEAQNQALFDQKLAAEEVWVRQGVKARRTRNQGRVRELEKMRAERRERREHVGNVRMQAQDAERSGQLVMCAEGVSFSYEGRPIIQDFSATIMRGDKVGIMGPNGAGKTTLLRLILGELQPDSGKIRLGTNLQISYFDQMRAQLDESRSAQENIADGVENLTINGKPRHIVGYLQDFLFTPERARSLVKYLSGGERNRLLLARLFTKPSNILVLDEPTNDLDAETLELLEELLAEYTGTLLLVSHDRAFLNNVVTSTLVIEAEGRVKEYDGGYDDWVRQRPVVSTTAAATKAAAASVKAEASEKPRAVTPAPRKLSFKDQRELDSLPARIQALETEQESLHQTMADPAFFKQSGAEIAKAKTRLEEVEQELEAAFARWEALES